MLHDGGLLLWFPGADLWVTVSLAFQSQSWHTDDPTGDPIEGKTGAEAALFDQHGRHLPAAERIHSVTDLVGSRVAESPRTPAAVLLLNTTDQDISLAGWSLVASRDDGQNLEVRAGQTLAVDVPQAFFEPAGGVVTLVNASGLKVAAATYPASFDAQPAWHKVV